MEVIPRRVGLERAVLLCSALFVLFLITRYDMCFQNSEDFPFDLAATTNGPSFSFSDIRMAFQVLQMEGDIRPRFLSYAAFILSLKTRLALWDVVPPHPSFSPVWLLTLVVGPVMLFRFLEGELRDRAAAIAGVAVYLVSTGCLSGITLLFHPAKPLATVLVIAVLYLSSGIGRDPKRERRSYVALLVLLTLAPFIDETAVFAYAIPCAWCPDVVKQRWRTFVLPAIVSGIVLLGLLPAFPSLVGATSFRLPGYLLRMANEGIQHDGWRFDLHRMLWNAVNLMIPPTLPWQMAKVAAPVAREAAIPFLATGALGVALLLVTGAMAHDRTHWPVYIKLMILGAVFVVFQTAVLVFHPLILTPTGFYYGAIFSVLLSSLVATVYASLRRRPRTMWLARGLLLWIVAISVWNFPSINSMYMLHTNPATLDDFQFMPWHRAVGDWPRSDSHRATDQPVPPYAPAGQYHYSPDDANRSPREHRADAVGMWRNWREGRSDYTGGRRVTVRQLWIINELWLKSRGALSADGV